MASFHGSLSRSQGPNAQGLCVPHAPVPLARTPHGTAPSTEPERLPLGALAPHWPFVRVCKHWSLHGLSRPWHGWLGTCAVFRHEHSCALQMRAHLCRPLPCAVWNKDHAAVTPLASGILQALPTCPACLTPTARYHARMSAMHGGK